MPVERCLLREKITYLQARDREVNVLHQLNYWPRRNEFFQFIDQRRSQIETLVAHHLGLRSRAMCHAASMNDWMSGSFNLVGDDVCPGNGDEKVKCEAGTYAWLQHNCPSVPIPHLYGFGLSTGHCMLSVTWKQQQTDKRLRTNLFRSLSNIILSLSQVRLPKIGSFSIESDGGLTLSNRPLTLMLQDLENECIPVNMPRYQSFPSVDSYINSLLSCHDNRLRYQPNAVKSEGDCVTQMTALALMRTVSHHFLDQRLNYGPFVLCLTDLHASNILVDEDWIVHCLIDLEWAASLPIKFMQTPTWLTDQAVDEIDQESYNSLREEFMDIFDKEERKTPAEHGLQRSPIMQKGWERGTFWYTIALRNPTGLHALFYNRVQPQYSETHASDTNFFFIVCQYWTSRAPKFIKVKLADKAAYDKKLQEEFGEC
ncbi:hypothetical protein AJ80_05925 [Polytolypa hystricis UAMH7299]|uniref:Aminoglycoside phosphotransferase domain-containing protein n=1 Tax=Polytolypa hystricis (strain UAMH7299) TaxID=1447883 RepID=A0A2B7XZM8_POLH7|nr:hypothetical protein AJ80_05925 [Polytolypa hystricis UAMH7299]